MHQSQLVNKALFNMRGRLFLIGHLYLRSKLCASALKRDVLQ